jgi:hypothetical protein
MTTADGTSYPAGEHAPATFPASCLGEQCPNFKGTPCENSYYEWIGAKAIVNEGRDTSEPPLVSEAIYVTYGQLCIKRRKRTAVRYRIDDYDNGQFANNETGLVVHGDSRFGDGVDVEVVKVQIDEDGSRAETLVHTYDGWG